MTTKLPNFLIAGMAKCGTSSLANYLQQHPDIFISARKEPRFFTSQDKEIFPLHGPKDDAVMDWYVPELENYKGLFKEADCKAIGEASADTVYFHKHTIPLIKEHLGNPKIIIILRNPVKRAFSAYQHLKRDLRDPLDFENALEAEPERVRANWELIYHYKTASLYYEPVKAFLENFDQVKVVLNEDLAKNPQSVLKECFEFLGVDESFEVDTSMKLNPSGIPKNRFVHDFLWKESKLKSAIRPLLRMFVRQQTLRKKIANKLIAKNLDKLQMSKDTEDRLKSFFKEDTFKTSQLINKDLTAWTH